MSPNSAGVVRADAVSKVADPPNKREMVASETVHASALSIPRTNSDGALHSVADDRNERASRESSDDQKPLMHVRSRGTRERARMRDERKHLANRLQQVA